MKQLFYNLSRATYAPICQAHIMKINKVVMAGLLVSIMSVGCESQNNNPQMDTLPLEYEGWQDKVSESYQKLTEDEQQLLDRYMKRMQLSEAYDKGATSPLTLGEAIEQQREYESLHPYNPTGQKEALNLNKQREQYPITLLPYQSNEADNVDEAELSFVFKNNGQSAIKSFKGTLLLHHPNLQKPKPVVIPLTQFDPPIEVNDSYTLNVLTEISDAVVMDVIQNPTKIDIEVSKGSLTLSSGEVLKFE